MNIGQIESVDSKREENMMDSWTCYLCLERTIRSFILSVKGYEVVGEVSDFIEHDDDGNEIGEFDYQNFPRVIDGINVIDVEDGFLISDEWIQDDSVDPLEFSLHEQNFETSIKNWLKQNKWPQSNCKKLLSIISA